MTSASDAALEADRGIVSVWAEADGRVSVLAAHPGVRRAGSGSRSGSDHGCFSIASTTSDILVRDSFAMRSRSSARAVCGSGAIDLSRTARSGSASLSGARRRHANDSLGDPARCVAAVRSARHVATRPRQGLGARAAPRRAVPGRDRPDLLPRSLVRRPAPDAVRSRDHRPRSRRAIASS